MPTGQSDGSNSPRCLDLYQVDKTNRLPSPGNHWLLMDCEKVTLTVVGAKMASHPCCNEIIDVDVLYNLSSRCSIQRGPSHFMHCGLHMRTSEAESVAYPGAVLNNN